MTELKVGDQVRITRESGHGFKTGDILTIFTVDPDDRDLTCEAGNSFSDRNWLYPTEFEVIPGEVVSDEVILRESDLPGVSPSEDPDQVRVGMCLFHRVHRDDDLTYALALIAAHRHFDANPHHDPATGLARVMVGGGDDINPLEITKFLPAARRVIDAYDIKPKA